MITGAPTEESENETEQLSNEFNWHEEEAGLKIPVVLVLANETVSPRIEPEAPDTFTEQLVDEPAATEAGLHMRVKAGVAR